MAHLILASDLAKEHKERYRYNVYKQIVSRLMQAYFTEPILYAPNENIRISLYEEWEAKARRRTFGT